MEFFLKHRVLNFLPCCSLSGRNQQDLPNRVDLFFNENIKKDGGVLVSQFKL
jgi:hypothetical protein